MNRLFVLLLGFGMLLTSCGPDYFYRHHYSIESGEWAYSDTLNFELEVTDTNRLYDLELIIEHGLDFPRQNMYVLFYTAFPDGQRQREMVSLEMADKAGVWYGKCRGETCRLIIPVQQGAYFNQLGSHVITIEQYTRVNPLPYVKEIGLDIIDTGEDR
jgi:gliding motility-associated lipoprotein GldH